MIALYIVLSVIGALLLFTFVSFLGPEKSENPFWQKVQKIRKIIDKVSYYTICAIAIAGLGFGVVAMIVSLIENYHKNHNVTGLLVSIALIGLIGFLIYLSIRKLVREHKNNIRCECIGDCSRCKIQCRSNPNYYGTGKKG